MRSVTYYAQELARLIGLIVVTSLPWFAGGVPLWARAVSSIGCLLCFGLLLAGRSQGNKTGLLTCCFFITCNLLLIYTGLQAINPMPAPISRLHHAIVPSQELIQTLPNQSLQWLPASVHVGHSQLQWLLYASAYLILLSSSLIWWEAGYLQILLGSIVLNGVLISLVGIFEQFQEKQNFLTWFGYEFHPHSFGPFVNRNNAASYLLLCLAGSFGLRQLVSERDANRLWLIVDIATGAIAAGVVSTASRGGIIALVMGLGAFLVSVSQSRIRAYSIRRTLVVMGVLCSLGGLQAAIFRFRAIDMTASDRGRIEHWSHMLPAIQDFFVWGSGLGTYQDISPAYEPSNLWFVNADNQFLEFYLELGILGTFPILLAGALMSGFLMELRTKRGHSSVSRCGYCILLFIFVSQFTHACFDFGITIPSNLFLLATLTGAVISSGLRREEYYERRSNSIRMTTIPLAFGVLILLPASSLSWSLLHIIQNESKTLNASSGIQSLFSDMTLWKSPDFSAWSEANRIDGLLFEWTQNSSSVFPENNQTSKSPFEAMLNSLLSEQIDDTTTEKLKKLLSELSSALDKQILNDPMDASLYREKAAVDWLQQGSQCQVIENLHKASVIRPNDFEVGLAEVLLISLSDDEDGIGQRLESLLARFPEKSDTALIHLSKQIPIERLICTYLVLDPHAILSVLLKIKEPALKIAWASKVQYIMSQESEGAIPALPYLQAVCLMILGRSSDSLPFFRQAIVNEPFSPELREGYILALRKCGDFESVETERIKAARMFPLDQRFSSDS